MTSFEVTAKDRVTAHQKMRELEKSGKNTVARAINSVLFAESFPNSYTNHAVELSYAVILHLSAMSEDDLFEASRQVEFLQSNDMWYRR